MSKNGNITTVQYDVKNLIFAEYNPRELTKDQHQDLKDSITRFGFVDPLIVNTHKERKNILVGGHQRLRIAKELGYKDVPCVEVDLTPDKEKELNVRLNKNTGQWDWDALANHFDVGELLEWGFSEDELQFTEPEEVQGLTDDDDVPEVEEAITKQGDLWILGEHRLLCGDATKKEDVERLMDGQKADMVFTDPPYDYESLGKGGAFAKQNDKVKSDIMHISKFDPFPFLNLLGTYFKNHTVNAYIFCNRSLIPKYLNFAEDKKLTFDLLTWHKKTFIPNAGQHHYPDTEYIIFYKKSGIFNSGLNSEHYNKYYITDKDKELTVKHPTLKPIKIISLKIKLSSILNGIVVDTFLGSGSTLIACEKTNRKCYGMEIDPHYCDVIVKRWEDYTGNKAERFEAANA